MRKHTLFRLSGPFWRAVLLTGLFFAGPSCCRVERRLTINTDPRGAVVLLNDEEIGTSPVTVSFEWYGDYNVTLRKEGFETLKTHRLLKAPWYDAFPFDFLAQLLPKRTIDSYEWTFELSPRRDITREELLHKAEQLRDKAHSSSTNPPYTETMNYEQ